MTTPTDAERWPSPDLAPEATLALADERTRKLLDAVRELGDDDVRQQSSLPGWTRAHVLTHLARNADALLNLCTAARTGVDLPMYESREKRDADIEEGSGRTAEALLEDLSVSAAAVAAAMRAIPDERWTAEVRHGVENEERKPAWWIPMMRLSEIELHHLDLDIGYDPQSWASAWVHAALPDAVDRLDERAGEPIELHATENDERHGSSGGRTVSGTEATLLAWVTGRSDGSDLTVEPAGELPDLGDWR